MTNTQKMVRLNLDLSPELNEILDELANKIGTNKGDVLRQAITLMQIMVIAKEKTKKLGVIVVGWVEERNPTFPSLLGFTAFNPTYS